MPHSTESGDSERVWVFSAIFGLVAGLCCLTPIVLVLLGVATISAANSLGNILYGEYRWAFRAAALASLVAAIVVHFRRRGVCTLDEARRRRNAILNFSVLALILGIGIYIFWTYIILHYWGIAVGLPWSGYDESWATPAAILAFSSALVVYLARRFSAHRHEAVRSRP